MGNFAPSEILNVTYAEWELRKGSNPVFYVQGANSAGVTQYVAITGNVDNQFWTRVNIAADITDFEADHKPGGTSVPTLEDGIARLVGPKNVVSVPAGVGSGQNGLPRALIIDTATPVAAGATFTILDYTATGGLCDLIVIDAEGDDKAEVILTVDGTEIYRLTPRTVQSVISKERATVIFGGPGPPVFYDHYPLPFSFKSSLKVEWKNTGTSTKDIRGVIIRYRVP